MRELAGASQAGPSQVATCEIGMVVWSAVGKVAMPEKLFAQVHSYLGGIFFVMGRRVKIESDF